MPRTKPLPRSKVFCAALPMGMPHFVLDVNDLEAARRLVAERNRMEPWMIWWVEPWQTDCRIDPEAGDLEGGYLKWLERGEGQNDDDEEGGNEEPDLYHRRIVGTDRVEDAE